MRALDSPAVWKPVGTNAFVGIKPVVSHKNGGPRRLNTPGFFLGNLTWHPQFRLRVGDGEKGV